MKKRKVIWIISCITLFIPLLNAQNSEIVIPYYYNNNKIYIPLNTNKVIVYLNESIEKTSLKKFKINNKTIVSDLPELKYRYQLSIESKNYDSIVDVLKKDSFLYAVEPVIGDTHSIGVSNIFYVKLKQINDIIKLIDLAKKTKTTILYPVPYCDNWYAIETNKYSLGNSIDASNFFWETKLFESVDPGFIFNYRSNTTCPSDSLLNNQWALSSIHACNAWTITTGDSNVNLAIIDQGVDVNHRELLNTKVNYSYDVETSTTPANIYFQGHDSDYHGIHVGGIIFANHNAHGIAGIAPNVSLINISHAMSIRDEKLSEKFAAAFNIAINNKARIINNSWGDAGGTINNVHSTLLEDAINNALNDNCVVIFAIGNHAPTIDYPASYNKKILTVGALTSLHKRAGFSAYGDELDVVAPGVSIISTYYNNSYEIWDGTSMAAPHVSGIAGLILSINPALTGQQVRDIIESTAQKLDEYSFQPANSDHPNGTWNNEVGYGMVDAYAAVQKAMNHRNDLYIRDTVTDNGTTPSSVKYAHNSPDIWTTDLNNNICNPTGGENCYVCVRIHNKTDCASSGRESLIVNWAKAGLDLSWNHGWIGDNSFSSVLPASGYVTDTIIPIPVIPAGGDTVLRILWLAPDPADYTSFLPFSTNSDWWHFCLAARVHDGTPIVGENNRLLNMTTFTKNNDNVAWKNISIVSNNCFGGAISVSNTTTGAMTANIDLVEAGNGNTPSITDYAEVYITLDAGLLNVINSANITGLDWVNSNTLRWNGGSASIPVTLPANSYYTLQTTVHFIADQIPASNNFDFDMVLRNATGDSILGGEHYRCVRTNGRFFQTCISRSESVLWGESVTLTACDIEEDAEYIWYDNQGEEVGYGLTCDVAPLQPTTYTLRVTADEDGYRTYCQLTVNVTDGELRLLAPNPADNQVRIGYALSRNISAATLQILNGSGQMVYSQALSGGNGSKVTGETLVNTSSLAAGSYSVRLVSNRGNIFDSKTLIIQ